METASDQWLADLDGDGGADLAIGRLPVASREAAAQVQKILDYEAGVRSGHSREAIFAAGANDEFAVCSGRQVTAVDWGHGGLARGVDLTRRRG